MLTLATVFHPVRRARPWRRLALLSAALMVLLLVVFKPALAAAQGSDPAANALLSSPPHQLSIPVAGHPTAGTLTVLGTGGHPLVSRPATVGGGRLQATLPTTLKPGVYTVVWRAPGADPSDGAFAFSVSAPGVAPALVDDAAPNAQLNPLWMGLPRFFAFALEMTMIGTLALRFLVTRPAIRELGARAGKVDRRLLQVAAVSGVLFIPAYLSQLVVESSDPDLQLGFWAMIRPAAIWTYLTTTADGHVWETRLVLALLAVALLVPAAAATVRRSWAPTRRDERIMALALGVGIAELLARVIPTSTPPNWAREIFTQLLDFGHLTGASVWVGGLVGLSALALSVRSINVEAPSLWGAFLRRFSVVATVCVGVMILTGVWTYWLHVGSPKLLIHTLYGETLLVKLVLVAALLGLGAVNQLWLLPRVQALRASGIEGSALGLTLRHFRLVVAVEAVIGLGILFVVPQLSSSARNQSFQQHGGGLTATAVAGDAQIGLRRSGLEPGITDYDLTVPGADGRAVAVTFSSADHRVPAMRVPATAVGGDSYRVTGLYTPLVGTWDATVRVAGGSTARFSLPVTAAPPMPAKAPQPSIKASTWIWGVGWVIVVVLALLGAGVASRRQIDRHVRALADDTA